MKQSPWLRYGAFIIYLCFVYVLLFQYFTRADVTEVEDTEQGERAASSTASNSSAPSVKEPTKTKEVAPMTEDADEEILSEGTFEPRAHAGKGKVRIEQNGSERVLVFDDAFRTDAGPDVHVYVSAAQNPATSAELHAASFIDVGALESTAGSQTYRIPDDVDFDINSIVVYCVPYKVLFTVASINSL